MNRTIYKYGPMLPGTAVEILLPEGSKVIHFAKVYHGLSDNKSLMVWIERWTDENRQKKYSTHEFLVVGTGWDIEPDMTHGGTIVDDELGFVWHLYHREVKSV